MDVYFFSRHNPLPEMVAELGKITFQYRGTISSVRKDGDNIKFLELPLDGSNAVSHSISANSIVVVVAPLALQEQWLKAGVAILLIPQNKKETTVSGEAVFSYSGLLQIMEIKVLSKQWSGVPVSWQEKHSERSVAPKY
ncbi:MAG: hypothetical protein ACKPFA_36215 [Dolichospermum sp.]